MAAARTSLLALGLALALAPAAAAPRPLDALYPSLDPALLEKARQAGGLSAPADSAAALSLVPAGEAGAALRKALEGRRYSFLVETLALVAEGIPEGEGKLGLFNAMTSFRELSGLTYRSHSRGEGAVLFDEATRISDLKKAAPLPDEALVALPEAAEYLVRLKDANFGTSYYRVGIDSRLPGLLFSMVNAKPLSVFLVTVAGEGEFFSLFYVERVEEGLLVYGLSGAKVGGFAAKRVDLPSAVRKRAAALRTWITGSRG
ncbi:MAG TPA: hypothetical protein PLB91_02255 [Spirochaetales bacterium]|nr:hypothetical protein [Spirochaetales bacterium]HRY53108.1 hypothetical protein [Spirochaetia bacterium]HRZ64675.1 hypothetical protein [Spirochaetia bacterium]